MHFQEIISQVLRFLRFQDEECETMSGELLAALCRSF